MDWTKIIQDIVDSGMTQSQIAAACKTGQSHISGLLHGKRKQPNWQLGDCLLSLHRKRCGCRKPTKRKRCVHGIDFKKIGQ